MGHRIVKEKLSHNRERFVVQTNNGLFGLKRLLNIWTTETFVYDLNTFEAIFNSYEEAEEFCNDIYKYSDDKVLKSDVVKVYDD